jgi:hypothetical protein
MTPMGYYISEQVMDLVLKLDGENRRPSLDENGIIVPAKRLQLQVLNSDPCGYMNFTTPKTKPISAEPNNHELRNEK